MNKIRKLYESKKKNLTNDVVNDIDEIIRFDEKRDAS